MKKSAVLLVFLMLLCDLHCKGQIFRVKAGYNLADMKVGGSDGMDGNKPISGFHAGLTTEFSLIPNLSIEPGLLYSTKGSKGDYFAMEEWGSYKTNLQYLDIPFNFKFSKSVNQRLKLFVLAGPYFGVGISGKYKWEAVGMTGNTLTDERNIKWGKGKDYQRFDTGASLGAGMEVRRLQFSVSYDYGLSKMVDFGTVYVNNRVLKVSLGYRFGKSA